MNNLRVVTRYYTPGMLELGIWLTEEEYRRMNDVIVCGPPDSPAPETLDSDLPDYETMMAANIPTSGECIVVSTKNEVTDGESLSVCVTPRNSPEPEPLEASDAYSDTSYTYEPSSESSQDDSDSDTSYEASSERLQDESDTSRGYEASSEYSEEDCESSRSGSIYTPDRNNIMERYVPTPISSRKRIRNRRLSFNDMNMESDRLDIAVEKSENDEPEPKRAAITKWINDVEQLYDLRRPTRDDIDDEE